MEYCEECAEPKLMSCSKCKRSYLLVNFSGKRKDHQDCYSLALVGSIFLAFLMIVFGGIILMKYLFNIGVQNGRKSI